MSFILGVGFHECGTCEYWAGTRDINSSNQATVSDMQTKGKCTNEDNSFHYRDMVPANGSCGGRYWTAWSPIDR